MRKSNWIISAQKGIKFQKYLSLPPPSYSVREIPQPFASTLISLKESLRPMNRGKNVSYSTTQQTWEWERNDAYHMQSVENKTLANMIHHMNICVESAKNTPQGFQTSFNSNLKSTISQNSKSNKLPKRQKNESLNVFFHVNLSRIHSTSEDMGYPTARRCTLRALHWWVCWYTRAWRTDMIRWLDVFFQTKGITWR